VKVSCSQCGSEQVVMESDFFLRCPYCDARIIVAPPRSAPAIVQPSITEEYVRRIFPSGMVLSLDKSYFPYIEAGEGTSMRLVPCFSQPWQELESYRPPAGDRKVFDESMAEPGEIIPVNRDLAEELGGRLVFHPFFVVMLKLRGYGEGVLVDGVSGKLLGEPPLEGSEEDRGGELRGLFFKMLLLGLVISVPLYIIGSSLDTAWISRIWTYVLIIALGLAVFYARTGRGRR